MISSLEITNFRCFERFEARNLARVNLLVGMNNSGKTSLLEAIELWARRAASAARTLEEILERRGEYLHTTDPRRPRIAFPVRHLFHGHIVEPGRSFDILAVQDGTPHHIQVTIVQEGLSESIASSTQVDLFDENTLKEEPIERQAHLLITDETEGGYALRLTPDGAFRRARSGRVLLGEPRQEDVYSTRFITTQSLGPDEVAALFGEYVLTEEEKHIIGSLQIIEPSIERLALAVSDVRYGQERAGIFVKCAGQTQRIPIGSMGDGIWRMLALTLALVGSRGGILLVDEIDTGLHFSVMTKMWKLVIETARRLDVQVFATTHSRDCYESLATALYDLESPAGTAAVHRIERDRGRTVKFNEQQLIIAAERDLEVR